LFTPGAGPLHSNDFWLACFQRIGLDRFGYTGEDCEFTEFVGSENRCFSKSRLN
jgi:hypothetical protein